MDDPLVLSHFPVELLIDPIIWQTRTRHQTISGKASEKRRKLPV